MRWISFILFTWYLRLLATRRTAKETLAKTALKGRKEKRMLRIRSDNNDDKTKKRKSEKGMEKKTEREKVKKREKINIEDDDEKLWACMCLHMSVRSVCTWCGG